MDSCALECVSWDPNGQRSIHDTLRTLYLHNSSGSSDGNSSSDPWERNPSTIITPYHGTLPYLRP